MAVVRWGRSDFSSVAVTKVRWGRADLTGTGPVGVKVRWGRSDLVGTAAVLLNAIDPQTVEPETVVTVTAVLTAGGSADSWTWRRISGPTISLTGTGATRTFRAPSAMPPGTSVVVGVTATIGGVTSPERTVTITSLPQLAWSLQAGVWVGRQPVISL